jgi:adenylate cyclase
MSDLRGFTALCEHIEPEPMILMLNHYLGEMIDAIEKYNGTLIEIEGDGMLAVFGALGEDPVHAEHAVAAALSMQSRLTEVNAWNEERGYPNLQMGIGINSGEAIVGNIGSEKRTRFNVIGSEVNLCGRIESYTVDGQVLISPNTRKLVGAELTISRKMVVRPKGVEEELELCQITAIGEPYNLKGRDETREVSLLATPIPVTFYRLENKHENEIPYFGGIMGVGPNTAVLNTQTLLSAYDNIRINAGGKLLCKVVEERKDGYLLRYTSIPIGYSEWLKENFEKNNKTKG